MAEVVCFATVVDDFSMGLPMTAGTATESKRMDERNFILTTSNE